MALPLWPMLMDTQSFAFTFLIILKSECVTVLRPTCEYDGDPVSFLYVLPGFTKRISLVKIV